MIRYVALLRAVNVGGTGKLPMSELKAMCLQAGFAEPQTYIASGNVAFGSLSSADEVKSVLESKLLAYAGKKVGVLVRTAEELQAVLTANPYADLPAKSSVAIFLDGPPPADALEKVTGRNGELTALGWREIYVHYGPGMGQSKLRIPAAAAGTARNMNTVAALAKIAAQR